MTLNPAGLPRELAYVAVYLAAAIEGEVVFLGASALVERGLLDPFGVLVAGTLGAATGDQIPFYLARCGFRKWLDRVHRLKAIRERIVPAVLRHGALLSFGCRFSPGLRITIASACGVAGVRPGVFTPLNLLGAALWASSLLMAVAVMGSAWLAAAGLRAPWGLVVPAVAAVIAFRCVGRWMSRTLAQKGDLSEPGQRERPSAG